MPQLSDWAPHIYDTYILLMDVQMHNVMLIMILTTLSVSELNSDGEIAAPLCNNICEHINEICGQCDRDG